MKFVDDDDDNDNVIYHHHGIWNPVIIKLRLYMAAGRLVINLKRCLHYGVWPKMSNQHDVSVQNLTTVEVDNKSILFYTNTN